MVSIRPAEGAAINVRTPFIADSRVRSKSFPTGFWLLRSTSMPVKRLRSSAFSFFSTVKRAKFASDLKNSSGLSQMRSGASAGRCGSAASTL